MNPTILYPLATVLLVSSVFDLRFQRIPNWITFTAMVVGLTLNGYASGLAGLTDSAGGILLGTGIFIIPYAMGGMGAGDAKLMGAVGAFLGVAGVLVAALLTMAVGGLYAIFLMIRHWRYGKQILRGFKDSLVSLVLMGRKAPSGTTGTDDANKPRLCYGVAIAAGTLLYMVLESAGYRFPLL